MGRKLPRRMRRAWFGVIVVSVVLLLSGCSDADKTQLRRLAMPVSATKEAPHVYNLWWGAWIAAAAVGVLVWGLILYACVRYRRRSDDEIPVQTRYNLPIEIFYTVAPIMMVIVFFFFTVKTQDEVLHDNPNADHNLLVVGQQWSWTFNYRSEDAAGGRTVYDPGTPANPPTLWLVKDQTVEVHLYSPDVNHSFWVPAFLFKMDVIPGRDNHFGFTPNRYGTFQGRCAEYCGLYHSKMLFNVRVVDQDAFDAHMRSLVKQGFVGLNRGGNNVNETPGLEQTGAKQ